MAELLFLLAVLIGLSSIFLEVAVKRHIANLSAKVGVSEGVIMLTIASLFSVGLMAILLSATRDASDYAEYMARLEKSSTFQGRVACEEGGITVIGTQVLNYELGGTTYSTKYPVEFKHRSDYMCNLGYKPRVSVVAGVLKDDQEVIKEAITADLTSAAYPENVSERQRKVASKIAGGLRPRNTNVVQMEVRPDGALVNTSPPLVKVPVNMQPSPSSEVSRNEEDLSRQISGQ